MMVCMVVVVVFDSSVAVFSNRTLIVVVGASTGIVRARLVLRLLLVVLVAPVLFEVLAEDLYILDSETGLEVAADVDVIAAADVVLPVPESQCHLSCRH